MSQQPPKRKRIVPVPVPPQETNASGLQQASPDEIPARPGPTEYHQGPSSLPGRRLKGDISRNYIIDYKELLRENGLDIKQLNARKAAAAPAKQGNALNGLPPLFGLARAGTSPAGANALMKSVVSRVEFMYGRWQESDEDEESNPDEGEEGESQAGASSESGSESDEEGGSGGEGAEPEQDTDGAAGTASGAASDGAAPAVAKKRRRRRPEIVAYDSDFIDDEEEIRVERDRQVKLKFDGFWVNQGPLEVEVGPEDEPQRRQGPRKTRPAGAGSQPGKAKHQEQEQQEPQGQQGAKQQQASKQVAGAGGPSTPVRKRRAEADGEQKAVKKRKQPAAPAQPDQQPAAPTEEARAPAAAAAAPAGPAAPQRPAAMSLAALAASMGKSTATAAAAAAPSKAGQQAEGAPTQDRAQPEDAAALAAPAAAAPAPAAAAAGPPPAAPAGPSAAGAGSAAGGSQPAKAAGRRASASGPSLDSLIADCRKKVEGAANPPADWAQLLKVAKSPLTQVALHLHRTHATGSPGFEAGLSQLATALAEAAPAVAGGGLMSVVADLRTALKARVEDNRNNLASMVTTLQRLAVEAAEAETAAGAAGGAAGSAADASTHSSDEEFTEGAGAAAATAHLASLGAKLRSYLNLYHKLHSGQDDEAVLQALAAQVKVDVAVLRRAHTVNQSKAGLQRKRQAGKAAGAATTGGDDVQQMAANIALEIFRGTKEGQEAAAATAAEPMAASAATAAAGPSTAPAAAGPAAGGSGVDEPAPAAPPATGGGGGSGSAETQHEFPDPARDDAQRAKARQDALHTTPTVSEELLDRAFKAASASDWARLVVKVLCYEAEGLKAAQIGQRARELDFIFWPATKPTHDMSRLVSGAIRSTVMGPHIIHVGEQRYMLQALKPDLKPVPLPTPRPRGGGGSAASSPAAVAPPGGAAPRAATMAPMAAEGEAPPPFKLPDEPLDAAGAAAAAGGAAGGSAAAAAEGAAAGAAGGGGGGGGGGAGEEEVELPSAPEDERQCRECVEAAVREGADRQQVEAALTNLKARNARILFKVLCHAGPSGIKVADVPQAAQANNFVRWGSGGALASRFHKVISSSTCSNLVAHVGNHMYALSLFPNVAHVPKPGAVRAGRGGGGGGGGAGGAGGGGKGGAAAEAAAGGGAPAADA